jgi:hypothetical protein
MLIAAGHAGADSPSDAAAAAGAAAGVTQLLVMLCRSFCLAVHRHAGRVAVHVYMYAPHALFYRKTVGPAL